MNMPEGVRILLVGDIALGGDFARRYMRNGSNPAKPFAGVRTLFSAGDVKIGNLESPIASGSSPQKKRNRLSAPEQAVGVLSALGFSALSLANNHICDQGLSGLTKTRALLKTHGIKRFGAGPDLTTAHQPAFVRHKDRVIACMGYACQVVT